MKTIFTIGLSVMIFAQLFIPARMVWQSERSLSDGTVFKFKTEPIDPSDPFRGKYISLNIKEELVIIDTIEFSEYSAYAFVELGVDSAGFAIITELHKTRPEHTSDYVKVKYRYWDDTKVRVIYPFERFYMEESKAQPAEDLYWESNRGGVECYVAVSILDGASVINDVYIGGIPISEAIETSIISY